MDLAAQDPWSQGQANLYLGIVAESSAEPQAASSYFRDVACQRPWADVSSPPLRARTADAAATTSPWGKTEMSPAT